MSDQTVVAAAVEVKAVVARDIDVVTEGFIKVNPTYKVRKTESKTFRPITLIENEKVNWKKGLVYLTARFSKGVNLEMWVYNPDGGEGLAKFNGRFQALVSESIVSKPCGKAIKLRCQILDTDTEDEMMAKIEAFSKAVEPTVTEVRAEIPDPVIVSKKETAKVEAPVVPDAEATADAAVEAALNASKPEAKKSGKKSSKK